MLQEIKTLVQTLNEQRDAYYNKDSPKMTDKEYDRLFDRLEELEKKSGIIFSNSPTQSVGYYPVSELAKVRHTRALLSIEKTKQIRELADFMENQDTLLMLKLDGLTVKLVYEEGRLVQASTRGDGNIGRILPTISLHLKIFRFLSVIGKGLLRLARHLSIRTIFAS